jgi:tetratricopeptide (TPR) repeat protein
MPEVSSHMHTSTPAASQPVQIFFSYAHRDEALRDELAKHLDILRRQGVISTWHDRCITAGRECAGQIDRELETADIILLLISVDFLSSDYINDLELKRAMARHEAQSAQVVPVILRPCLWKRCAVAKLQALPTDGEPVTSGKWASQDAAFLVVAEGIARAVDEHIGRRRAEAAARPGSPAAPTWHVPFRRNVSFTGRKGLLDELHRALHRGAAVALTGLGGIGKTQLALEYAYRHRDEYRVVWWVRAEDEATLAADYTELAVALGLAEREAKEQSVAVAAVRLWLEQNTGCLLVFDNAENRAAVRDYVPQGRGAVIITSREPVWSGVATPFRLEVLAAEEAVAFLCGRTGDTDAAAAAALAEVLGQLPLALEQAAAYVEDTGGTLQHYRELFDKHHAALLQQGRLSTDYPDTVATTWALSIGKVDQAARVLLNLCAFFAPDGIPLDAIREGARSLPSPFDSVAADAVRLDSAIAGLLRFSLIGRKGEDLSVHRLVQAVVRDRLSDAQRRTWARAAVGLLNQRFPFDSDDVRTWPVCARLLAHALQAAHWTEALATAPEAAARLLNQVGLYLRARAEFTNARALYERALRIGEAALGAEHHDVGTVANNLGLVLQALGDLPGARVLYERALRIGEAALGMKHPTVATYADNLGLVLQAQGDFPGARALFERALRIADAALGAEHPMVATYANNLGVVLRAQGDFAGARELFERALQIDEEAYGPDHPDVARDANNLGSLLQDLDDHIGARGLFERALRISVAALGAEHPTVAACANNLGSVLQDLGDLAGAQALYERALRIDEAAYGPGHPDVARNANNLGSVLQRQGDFAGARVLYERALRIFRVAFGDDHRRTKTIRRNLEILLQQMSPESEARLP